MNMERKIGIFDSGIGGVTVFKEILKVMPNDNYIYYSDSLNNPYGDMNDEDIFSACTNIVEQLILQNCNIIVIACNTASAKAAELLRKKFPKIDIFAIEPAYKMVYDYAYDEKTLIMATKGTIESEKFNLLYQKYNNNNTEIISCVGLADLIENDEQENLDVYLEEYLSKYKGQIKNVVLGCTHYPLVIENIKKVLGDVVFFHGAKNLASYLKTKIDRNELLCEKTKEGRIEFIDSSNSRKKEKRFFELLSSK